MELRRKSQILISVFVFILFSVFIDDETFVEAISSVEWRPLGEIQEAGSWARVINGSRLESFGYQAPDFKVRDYNSSMDIYERSYVGLAAIDDGRKHRQQREKSWAEILQLGNTTTSYGYEDAASNSHDKWMSLKPFPPICSLCAGLFLLFGLVHLAVLMFVRGRDDQIHSLPRQQTEVTVSSSAWCLNENTIMKAHHAYILCILLLGFTTYSYGDNNIVNVGLIVDNGSWVGEIIHSCINMAISDFYNLNNTPYKTKIALHVRDCRGDSLHCISAALDLLVNFEVQAIIIPQVSNKELFLASLGDEANVPILSFSSMSSFSEHPYFIQVGEDYNNQFHGIAVFVKSFNWSNVVFMYEDTDDARQAQTYIYEIFQENQLSVAYQTAISLTATDDHIINELHKLMMMKSSIILVHLSPSLASRVFTNAKMLGMMSKGYAWIVTSKTMNFLTFKEYSSVYESMEGVIGFKSYISMSSKLQNLNSRWRREFQQTEPNFEIRELNVYGLWAYDAAWVLAAAIENAGIQLSQNQVEGLGLKHLDLTRLRVSDSGPSILSKITSSKFTGLAGEFQLKNRKLVHETYEVLNVIGKGERRVGIWRFSYGITKEIYPYEKSFSNSLEAIIWPGFSLTAPESWSVQTTAKWLKVGIPANGRFHELVGLHNDTQTNITTPIGFCIDLFSAVVERLPYKLYIEYIPFFKHNGTYNDLVNQVYLQTFDAAVGDITIFSNRSDYVDFTVPYTEPGVGVLVKLDDKDRWFFLKPLHADLWITSACFVVLTGFIVWLIEHPINEEFQGPPARQIGTLLSFAVSTLVYAHRERLQSNVSRFVMGVWLFVVLILTSSYTANLSSLLTIEQIKLTKSDYIGYSANTPIRGIIGNNLNFRDNRLKPYQSPEEYDEALRKGSREGGVGAIIDEIPYIKIFLARYPHHYAMVQSLMTTNGFGFAFQKGSPLVHEVSRAIAELREEGTILELEKKWFKSQSSLLSQDTEPPKFNTLSVDNFFGLFLVSGIANSIAALILVVFLLGKRLSMNYYIFTMLSRGNLIFILRHLYPRMDNIIDGTDGR
ncbi:hypothetical protein BUALT_Bualt02G0167200 [Buddleja alternifolia]|uniref:Ionotropic glutamate receptor C-terminal domain-containing protein n=1 Tax=Buddleja alternifolia TaxID=168488 RepID=A0AAV6Y1N0_9LAMI|nr:hypothetical protein BUALT_Bualt02G0167200 [Buddleja alternifolia]